jgi:hypothetical protein
MSPTSDPMIIKVTVISYLSKLRVVWPAFLYRAGRFKILDQKFKLSLNWGRGFLDILQGLLLNGNRILHTIKVTIFGNRKQE